jgi:serine protease Do
MDRIVPQASLERIDMTDRSRGQWRSPQAIMKRILCFAASWILASVPGMAERPYVNDLAAPKTRKDLEMIQNAVKLALPQVRAATVCIEIGEGAGTGVIVSADGLILSAAHVTGAVGKKVKIKMEDGTEHTATTLGLVADTDAAMAKLEGQGPFPFVEIEREDSPRLGDWVFSVGHSGGFNKERGSVARLGRLVRIAQTTFQSDCALIGGDSGGPLFDLSGKLVGIHSRVGMKLQENMHVPMHVFFENWEAMLKSEFIGEGPFAKKPVLGNGFLGFASEAHEGGGVKFNGAEVSERGQLRDKLKEMAVGDEVVLVITREGKEQTLTFKLGER